MSQQQLYLVVAVLLVVGQTAVIVALLSQRARRERAERVRRESEERFRLTADNAPVSVQRYAAATAAGGVGVWDWNFETNEIYVDPNLQSILGFEDGEMTGRAEAWASLVHPEDLPIVTARVQECIEGRVPDYQVEHRMVHKDGSVRWFLSRGTLMRRANGSPHRMVGTKVDITARKVAEDAIRENQAVLHATNRELQTLAGRLIAAQEVERGRIARELHDDISQQVAGLSIAPQRAQAPARRARPQRSGCGPVRSPAAHDRARGGHPARVTRPPPQCAQHAGLVAALTAHCAGIQRGPNLTVDVRRRTGISRRSAATSPVPVSRRPGSAAQRCHSLGRPPRAMSTCAVTGNLAELTVTDDGDGFDISQARTSLKGLGLVSITERVRLAGGGVSIVTELRQGHARPRPGPGRRVRAGHRCRGLHPGRQLRRRLGLTGPFLMTSRATTVLIADDHTIVKEGIVSLLKAHDFDVVGAVGDGISSSRRPAS